MRVHRTHDGRTFDIAQPFEVFRDKSDLISAIALVSSIAVDEIICMTSNGQQLTEEVFKHLQDEEARPSSSRNVASTTDLYLFNRQFLYSEIDSLLQELEEPEYIESFVDLPTFGYPPTPKALDAVIAWSSAVLGNVERHAKRADALLHELTTIDRGTGVALANLLSHADTIRAGAEALETSAAKELERMDDLLATHSTSLKTLSLVQINPKLLPPPSENRPRPTERTLADYISLPKLTAVHDSCSEVFRELQQTLATLRRNGVQLVNDTGDLKTEVDSTSIEPSHETHEEAAQSYARAQNLQRFLLETCSPDEPGWPAAERLATDQELFGQVEDSYRELILVDDVAREAVKRLVADKNDMMARSLHLLSDISSLQSEHADLGASLAQLDTDFRSKRTDGFRHLSRLRNMLWAYGSTLIEAHRRREFSKRFLNHSQALAEVMASFSESETRRRKDFRAQVAGALPFEVKGVEDATPSLEISTGGTTTGSLADIDQDDVEAFFILLVTIEQQLGPGEPSKDIAEVRASAQRLLASLDDAEAEFEKLVEVTLLERQYQSSSDDETAERPARRILPKEKDHYEKEVQDLRLQLADAERAIAEEHDKELTALRTELLNTKHDLRTRGTAHDTEVERHAETRRILEAVQADAETEHARRINMQEELGRLREEVEAARRDEKALRAEFVDETDRANDLAAHLTDLQAEFEEVKEARDDASHRVESLLSKGTSIEQELMGAQERIDELTHQLSSLRGEMREAHEALHEAESARDKLFRNYRAEADGDRAILEESLRTKEVELSKVKEELQRCESELTERIESANNLKSQLEAADEAHEELVRQLESTKEVSVDVDYAKRSSERSMDSITSHLRVLVASLIALLEHLERVQVPASSKSIRSTKANANGVKEMTIPDAVKSLSQSVNDISQDDLIDALGWITKSDPGTIAVKKLDALSSLCKKWIKAYKYSNEKVQKQMLTLREKITFRNFAVGDLALFLPTRSNMSSNVTASGDGSIIKPWAAFNINCPHYFLKFKGRAENEKLRDSLRYKEWIVARIVHIESQSATSQDGTATGGNPFQLAEGVQYYLLEIESWNLANSTVGPGLSRRKTSTSQQEDDAKVGSELSQATKEAGGVNGDKDITTLEDADANLTLDEPPLQTSAPQPDAGAMLGSESSRKPSLTRAKSGSESALTIAMRRRSSSPERKKAAADTDKTPKPARHSMASAARWPLPSERSSRGSDAGSVASGVSFASSANALRLLDGTHPAFGRSKRSRNAMKDTHKPAEGQASSLPKTGQRAILDETTPLSMAQHVMRQHSSVDEGLNPFSSSPSSADLAATIKPVRKAGTPVADEQQSGDADAASLGSVGKGKERAVDPAEDESVVHTARPQLLTSTSRRGSVASRLSSLHIKSKTSALSTPRLRAQATLAPSITMDTATGLNAQGAGAGSLSPPLSITSKVGESSKSAVQDDSGLMTRPTLSSGRSLSGTKSIPSRRGISVSSGTGVRTISSPVVQRSPVKTSEMSQKLGITPPSPLRRKSSKLFGGSWLFGGRRVSPNAPPMPFPSSPSGALAENDGDDDAMSSSPPSARQHLRRLASTSGI